MVKFIRKNVLEKAWTCGASVKIDPYGKKNNQKQISYIDLGFNINEEIRFLNQVNKRVNGVMIFHFKKEPVHFCLPFVHIKWGKVQ